MSACNLGDTGGVEPFVVVRVRVRGVGQSQGQSQDQGEGHDRGIHHCNHHPYPMAVVRVAARVSPKIALRGAHLRPETRHQRLEETWASFDFDFDLLPWRVPSNRLRVKVEVRLV